MEKEQADWRPLLKMIFVRVFRKMRDRGSNKSAVIARIRALIEELPKTVKNIRPLAKEDLLAEAKHIMREAAIEVFGDDFEPQIFEN